MLQEGREPPTDQDSRAIQVSPNPLVRAGLVQSRAASYLDVRDVVYDQVPSRARGERDGAFVREKMWILGQCP